jgi:enamine deaminase RidA (YjgF/YER057c/UK114 family)
MTAEERIRALGLVLPELASPRGCFQPFVLAGSMLYLSGKGSPLRGNLLPVPKVGVDMSVAEARACAQDVGLHLLAQMKAALGQFDRVRQVVKVLGMVNAAPDFTMHTEVVDGCSELLVAVLGDRGRHARSAIGVGSLPRGFAVEIEAIVEVAP